MLHHVDSCRNDIRRPWETAATPCGSRNTTIKAFVDESFRGLRGSALGGISSVCTYKSSGGRWRVVLPSCPPRGTTLHIPLQANWKVTSCCSNSPTAYKQAPSFGHFNYSLQVRVWCSGHTHTYTHMHACMLA